MNQHYEVIIVTSHSPTVTSTRPDMMFMLPGCNPNYNQLTVADSFTYWQHLLRSYQEKYQLVIVHTHGNIITMT